MIRMFHVIILKQILNSLIDPVIMKRTYSKNNSDEEGEKVFCFFPLHVLPIQPFSLSV